MRISRTILFAFLISLILTSCTTKESGPEIIHIDLDSKSEPLKINIEKIIPLETSEKSLLGYIGKVEIFDDRIYILNNNRFEKPTLYVYNINGKLLNKTKIGKGPGEVIEPFAMTIDKVDSIVYLHDQAGNGMKVFDLELNYIKTMEHDYVFITDFHHIRQDTFLVYNQTKNISYKESTDYLYYSLYTEGFTKVNQFNIPSYNISGSISIINEINNYNEILFYAPLNYNIYQLVGDSVKVRYCLDFDPYNLTHNQLTTLSFNEIRELTNQGKGVSGIYGMLKTFDFFVFMTSFKDKFSAYFKSLNNNKTYCFNDCIESNMIPDCFIRGITENGTYYAKINADKLIEFQKSSGKYKNLEVKEDDNPYIILFNVSEPE